LSPDQHDFSHTNRNINLSILVYLPELLSLTSLKSNFTIGDSNHSFIIKVEIQHFNLSVHFSSPYWLVDVVTLVTIR